MFSVYDILVKDTRRDSVIMAKRYLIAMFVALFAIMPFALGGCTDKEEAENNELSSAEIEIISGDWRLAERGIIIHIRGNEFYTTNAQNRSKIAYYGSDYFGEHRNDSLYFTIGIDDMKLACFPNKDRDKLFLYDSYGNLPGYTINDESYIFVRWNS